MSKSKRPGIDRNLGEHRRILRRDFLQGALVGAATALTGQLLRAHAGDLAGSGVAPEAQAGYYPPLLTGMRGSHPGSFESAQALRGNPTDNARMRELIGGTTVDWQDGMRRMAAKFHPELVGS